MTGFHIYLVTNNANGKVYVGLTTQSVSARWSAHVAAAKRGTKMPLCAAIRKYGKETFSVLHLASCRSAEHMYAAEKLVIEQENSRNPERGYNVSVGGEYGSLGCTRSVKWRSKMAMARKGNKHALGAIRSPETRAKMSAWQKGKRKLSQETRDKIKAARARQVMLPVSEEHRMKISLAKKGRPPSDSQRRALERLAESRIGVELTPEHRAKISAALNRSDAHKAHLRRLNASRWNQVPQE